MVNAFAETAVVTNGVRYADLPLTADDITHSLTYANPSTSNLPVVETEEANYKMAIYYEDLHIYTSKVKTTTCFTVPDTIQFADTTVLVSGFSLRDGAIAGELDKIRLSPVRNFVLNIGMYNKTEALIKGVEFLGDWESFEGTSFIFAYVPPKRLVWDKIVFPQNGYSLNIALAMPTVELTVERANVLELAVFPYAKRITIESCWRLYGLGAYPNPPKGGCESAWFPVLEELTLPQDGSLAYIQDFMSCIRGFNSYDNYFNRNLKGKIEIPEGVEEIYGSFFFAAPNAEVSLPKSLKVLRNVKLCPNVTSVCVPENVEIIESSLNGGFDFNTVFLPHKLKLIYSACFKNMNNNSTICCYAEIPPRLDNWAFTERYTSTLYVPEASIEAYKSADVWKEFGTILPLETYPGYDKVYSDEPEQPEPEEPSATVVCLLPEPPVMALAENFSAGKGSTLYVRSSCLEAYREASLWNGFENILPVEDRADYADVYKPIIDEMDNVGSPTVDGSPRSSAGSVRVRNGVISLPEATDITLTDLQGRSLYSGKTDKIRVVAPGLYILRTADGLTEKVTVK